MCHNLDLQFIIFYYHFIKFFPAPFLFFYLVFYCFSLFRFDFLSPFVSPLLFHSCFVLIFLAHAVSTLVYPNLLGTKRPGGCCRCTFTHLLGLLNVLVVFMKEPFIIYFGNACAINGRAIFRDYR
jgi:hypothetical protein